MQIFFADDSKQNSPTRDGMSSLVAVGGIRVKEENIQALERKIESLCQTTGFPPKEEFKWSPGRNLWMNRNLIGTDRTNFFLELVALLKEYEVHATVIIEDTSYAKAITDSDTYEEDVTRLLIERVHHSFSQDSSHGIVISDKQGGDASTDEAFLSRCLELLQQGTNFVQPDTIWLNVLSSPSHLIRLLQAADVITSCTLARVAGEETWSPPVYNEICDLFERRNGKIGGVGLKIHPDNRYVNLYHWLLGDPLWIRGNSGIPLPLPNFPYFNSEHSVST